ncbi:MAG: hypothetical protein U1F49_21210 [Rubrivivax sp.]
MPAALREAPAFDVAGDEVDVDVRGDVRGDAPTDIWPLRTRSVLHNPEAGMKA